MKLREALWVWGQDAGSHHNTLNGNIWNLPGENRLGPAEGCEWLGVPNCFRVVMNGRPVPPFDGEQEKLDGLRQVVWSLIGDSGSTRNNGETDLEEIVRIAESHPNITGAIMDDFMNPTRMKIFTPEKLKTIRERLHTALPDRPLDFWTVLYTGEVGETALEHLRQVDKISLWTWFARDLPSLDKNFTAAEALTGKKMAAGCYFYDYGDSRPMPMELMQFQLDTYGKWLREGRITGIIFCSNAIADIGLETVDYTRAWIAEHGDEEIG